MITGRKNNLQYRSDLIKPQGTIGDICFYREAKHVSYHMPQKSFYIFKEDAEIELNNLGLYGIDQAHIKYDAYVPVSLPNNESILLSYELKHIADAIKEAKHILEFQDDWDDAGANSTDLMTFKKAIDFLVLYSNHLSPFGIIAKPFIDIMRDGAVSIFWETSKATFLIIFNKGNLELSYFYAEEKTKKIPFRYAIEDVAQIDEIVAQWMREKPTLNPEDSLSDQDRVYRIAVHANRPGNEVYMPSTQQFSLSEADKADSFRMSTDWEGKTTPEESIARVGCSYKGNTTEFKSYTNRELYALNISFLKSLEHIYDVAYTPISNDPPIFGNPNNPAHSSICFKQQTFNEYAPMLFTKLRDHAKDQKINVDMDTVHHLVEQYKANPNG